MKLLEFLKAILVGIVEGITEWLPISSTGHMILVDEFVKLKVSEEFLSLFLVVIQLGAILAVPVFFFDKLNPWSKKKSEEEKKATWSLFGKVIVGVLPAAVLGFLLDDFLDAHLMNYIVVAAALIVYGILFIVIEKKRKGKAFRVETVDDLSYKDALVIGAYQVLSLVPGTSRSGSTILGGMLHGVSRTAAAEFSFFMAIPIMLGASGLKVLKFILAGFTASGLEIGLLFVGIAVSFIVSLLTIRFLMDFVKRHDFKPFGIYRIVLGALVLIYFLVKTLA
ncbi:MAG: undecaprenyl-diphosphate phosphatase [Clostridia bacterium]|nr:undecaprenyl-diphosphate phosphatase [Clostridia bacterium]